MNNYDRFQFILAVREPENRYEEDDLVALTRHRILEMFPSTPESYLQDQALLVRHPWLHQGTRARLLPADRLYEAIREEAESEFLAALVQLGATEIELSRSRETSARSEQSIQSRLGLGPFVTNGKWNHSETVAEASSHRMSLALAPRDQGTAKIYDEQAFFDSLIFNRDNKSLRILFRHISEGLQPGEFRLEFRHSVSRFHRLEEAISAKYANLFSAQVKLDAQFQANTIELAVFVARFGSE